MIEVILIAAGILLLLFDLIGALWIRKQLITYTSQVSDALDQMIEGSREIQFDEQQETLAARVQVKLRQLYEILDEKAEQSVKEKKELEEIVSDISHQVKTPIANLRMYDHILQERELPAVKRNEFLRSIDKQVEKLDSLMESMVKMSRLEVGIIEVEPKRAALYPMIQQAVCDIALKAEMKQINIAVVCDKNLQAFYDYKWTLEAVFNLLDNGVKYTPQGGKLQVRVSVTDFFAKISIADTGKGIHEEHLTEIFKRFYREMDVRETEGVGIGLFLARQIVEKQNGFIDVRSTIGSGSVFSIHLPVEL